MVLVGADDRMFSSSVGRCCRGTFFSVLGHPRCISEGDELPQQSSRHDETYKIRCNKTAPRQSMSSTKDHAWREVLKSELRQFEGSWISNLGWTKILAEPSIFWINTASRVARLEADNDDFFLSAPNDEDLDHRGDKHFPKTSNCRRFERI